LYRLSASHFAQKGAPSDECYQICGYGCAHLHHLRRCFNFDGKLTRESVIEAKRSTIVEFIQGLRGELFLAFEEGTWSGRLYDLLTPYVAKIVVCDPRRNAPLKEGSANDRIDARKLAELLRLNSLRSVYHGENGLRTLRELVRAYLTNCQDLVRVMNRVKAIYS
jgi:Transposase